MNYEQKSVIKNYWLIANTFIHVLDFTSKWLIEFTFGY